MPEDRPAQDSGVAAAAGPAAGGSHVAVGGGGQYDSDTGSEEPATASETVRERRLRELQLQVQRHQDIDNTHPFNGPFFRDYPGEPIPQR